MRPLRVLCPLHFFCILIHFSSSGSNDNNCKRCLICLFADCREQLKSAEAAADLQRHWVDRATLECIDGDSDYQGLGKGDSGGPGAVAGGIDIKEQCTEEEYIEQQLLHRHLVRQHKLREQQERLQLQHTSQIVGNNPLYFENNKKDSVLPKSKQQPRPTYPHNKTAGAGNNSAMAGGVKEVDGGCRSHDTLMNRLDQLLLQEEQENGQEHIDQDDDNDAAGNNQE